MATIACKRKGDKTPSPISTILIHGLKPVAIEMHNISTTTKHCSFGVHPFYPFNPRPRKIRI